MKKVEFRFLDSEYLVTSEGIASWQNKMPLKDIRMSRWGREEAVLTAWSSGVVPPTTVQSCCRRMAFCALVGQGCGWYPWQKENCNATSVLQLVTRKSIVGVLSTEIVIAGIRWLDVRLLYVPLGICLLTIRLVGRDVALIRVFALDNSGSKRLIMMKMVGHAMN